MGRNASDDGTDWTSGLASRLAPDRYFNLLVGTAKAQLPKLVTKSHLSPGALYLGQAIEHTSMFNGWLAGLDVYDLTTVQSGGDPDIPPIPPGLGMG